MPNDILYLHKALFLEKIGAIHFIYLFLILETTHYTGGTVSICLHFCSAGDEAQALIMSLP